MKFRNVNGALIPADEDAVNFSRANKDEKFLDMYSLLDIRTNEQNRKLWPMLTDFAKQIEWAGKHRSPYEWKYILSAAFEQTKLLPGLNDEIVPIPAQTSRYSKRKFADFIESIYGAGSHLGVKWSDPSMAFYDEMMTIKNQK